MSVFNILLSISAIISYLYFTTSEEEEENNIYRIFSIITILTLLFATPILSQESHDQIVNYYYGTTLQLKIIIGALITGVLYYVGNHSKDMYKNILIPIVLTILVILSPDISTGLSTNIMEVLKVLIDMNNGFMFHHLLVMITVFTFIYSWMFRSEYMTPFAWWLIVLILTNLELVNIPLFK